MHIDLEERCGQQIWVKRGLPQIPDLLSRMCVCVGGGVVCFVLFAKNISLYTVYLEKELLSMGDIWLNDKTGK